MENYSIYPLKGGYSKYLKRTVTNPIATCDDARFCQCIDRNRELKLVAGDKFTGILLWLDTKSGEEFLVPSLWYNQPVEWRIEAMKFQAERSRENARKIRQDKTHSWWRSDEQAALDTAKKLLSIAEKMRKTGKVLA